MVNIFCDTRIVRVFWFTKYEGKFYSYEQADGSLKTNPEEKSLRFELKEINGFDDNFQVVIKETEQGIVFMSDCYEDTSKEFLLKPFPSEDEIILFCEDKFDIIHFHVS